LLNKATDMVSGKGRVQISAGVLWPRLKVGFLGCRSEHGWAMKLLNFHSSLAFLDRLAGLDRLVGRARALGPYLAIELLLPGGSVAGSRGTSGPVWNAERLSATVITGGQNQSRPVQPEAFGAPRHVWAAPSKLN
jgi:hypothetical protein